MQLVGSFGKICVYIFVFLGGLALLNKLKLINSICLIAGYKNGRFLVYDPCYYSAGSGSSHRNAYDYGAIAWVPVSTIARESTGGSNNGTIMMN